jgi:hypothetical protein
MRNFLILSLLACIAATGATYYRYQSFDPCSWLEQEFADEWKAPRMIAKGRIMAEFYVRGVTDPSFSQCVSAWWHFRLDKPVHQSDGSKT